LPGILELRQEDGEGVYEDHTRPSHRHRIRPEEPQPLKGRRPWWARHFFVRLSRNAADMLLAHSVRVTATPTPLSPGADFSDRALSITAVTIPAMVREVILDNLMNIGTGVAV